MLASCNVIEEHNLSVLICLYLNSFCSITRGIFSGIDINNFSITFVSEEETCLRVSVNSEIRWFKKRAILSLPIIVWEVSLSGKEYFLAFKIESEIVSFQAMSKVNVTADLIFAIFVISDKDNGCHTSVSNKLLSFCQRL
jgi:hypothetical protein